MKKRILIFLLISNIAYASQPSLTIETPTKSKSFSTTDLLKMDVAHLTMNNSRAYLGITMKYEAVKLCEILKPFHVKQSDTVELISSDNFAVLVPAKYVLNCANHTPIGYLAIETADKPWPKLLHNNPDKSHADEGTAGPFAVIWVNAANLSNEYWAWKVVTIKVHDKLDPKIYLNAPSTDDKQVLNGYHIYVSHCAACHTINKIGKAVIGPDLNIPRNPTEYYSDVTLKKFIRDPQSVRKKKNDHMSGTSEETLSNKDLNDLVVYLRYMSKHKE